MSQALPDLGDLYISELTEKCSASELAEFTSTTIKTPLQQKKAELDLARGLTLCLLSSFGPNQDTEGRRKAFSDILATVAKTQNALTEEILEVKNGGAVLGYDTKNNAPAA